MPATGTLGTAWGPRFLSLFRLIAGLLFLEHGLSKLVGFPHVAAFHHLSPLLYAAGVIELVGGALVAVGLFTRPAAFIMSGEMACAYFMVPAHRGFYPELNGGDLVIMFCFTFFYFFLVGGGVWSIDRWFRRVAA